MGSVGRSVLLGACLLVCASVRPVAAQEPAGPALCKDRPCTVMVDWTRSGGLASLAPDRRYGNPAQLEEWLKAQMTRRGYTLHGSTDATALRIVLQPVIRDAMCDQLPGTATDMSCKAVTEIQARLEGPGDVLEGVDLPSTIRNRCGSDQIMAVDRLAVFVADWIIYAVDGKAKGERRPSSRC